MPRSIIEIINEEIALFENLQQAEKILKEKGIDPYDESFHAFKDLLVKNNNIGYLGFITKLSLDNQPVTTTTGEREDRWYFSHNRANTLYNNIIQNKHLLKLLPKDLFSYTNGRELADDLRTLPLKQQARKLATKLTNKKLVSELNNYVPTQAQSTAIDYLFKIPSEDRKEFLIKSDKYKSMDEMFDELHGFIEEHTIGFKYDIVLNKIKSMSPNEIKLLYADQEKKMILARILQYSAARELGSQSWCIAGDESQFESYTENGKNFQYYFFNFNSNIPANEKMLAFTMNSENRITASHDRYDGQFNNPVDYLQNLGILRKLIEINSRERAETKIAAIGGKTTGEYYSTPTEIILQDDDGNNRYFQHENMRNIFFQFLKIIHNVDIKSKSHLDLVVKKFENYPIQVIYKNFRTHQKTKTDKKNINGFPYIIQYYSEILKNYQYHTIELPHDNPYDEYSPTIDANEAKENFIKVLTHIYTSKIPLQQATKFDILRFLYDNNEDVLQLSKHAKLKRGQDLAPNEFAMLVKRGEDMRPYIQNKLAALRRGEDVNFNRPEIKYAIDNGYKDLITIYFRNQLPYFAENQLDYENMETYRQLGLMDELEPIIVNKGNVYGLDTLNSIERSIYDITTRKKSTQA